MERYVQYMLDKYPLMDETEEDKRDYNLDNVVGLNKTENLPSEYHIKYDYIPYKPKQKNISGCAACTAIAAMMIQLYTDKKLSWMFAYANRKDSDYQGKGTYIRELLSNIRDSGVTLIDLFNVMKDYPEIHEALINDPNKDLIFLEAAKNKITGYIKISEDDVNSMLAQDIPVLVGVRVYDSFYNTIKNNYIIPQASGNKRGAHEMLLLGYDDNTKLRNVLNWWDGEWDHELLLPYESNIVTDYFIITDKPVIKPEVKKYTVGWNEDNKGWWYSPQGLTYYKSEWKMINGNWFCFDDEGYAMQNKWTKYKNKWYYLDKDCYMVSNKWIKYKDKWYRLGQDGAMLTGWFKDSNGKWCYLDIDKGYAYKSCTILIDGKYYSFDEHCYWIENNGGVSDKGIDFIKSWEGFYSTPYYDCVGVKTLGYGMTGDEIKGLNYVTEPQASQMLKDLIDRKYAPPIKEDLDSKGITLKQCEFDALISFSFNCGTGGLLGSTLYKNICNGVRDENTIISNFTAWSNGGGHRIEGLYRRRCKEANMFLYGDYTGNN